jgi:hypothetical protein
MPTALAVFGWEGGCGWQYFDSVDGVEERLSEDAPAVDLRGCTWLGVRARPPVAHMQAVLERLGAMTFVLAPATNLGRYKLDESERAAAECLRVRAMSVDDLVRTDLVSRERAQAILYVLALFGEIVSKARSVPPPAAAVAARRPPSTPPLRLSGVVRKPTPHTPSGDPTVDASRLLADAMHAHLRGDLERAEVLCRRAHKMGARNPEAIALLAWIDAMKPEHLTRDEQRDRLEVIERAARAAPESTFVLYCRASMRKRFGDEAGAVRDLNRILQLDAQHVEAKRELRLIEIRQRRRVGA